MLSCAESLIRPDLPNPTAIAILSIKERPIVTYLVIVVIAALTAGSAV